MNLITFYADCNLPDKPKQNQRGFDWRNAIELLRRSAAKHGYTVQVVTDESTIMESPWLRVGDAKEGLMMWLLKAQAAAVAASEKPAIMVSPDTLIADRIDFMNGPDLTILTRLKPKPIVNSVIGFTPSAHLNALWSRFVETAQGLSQDSLAWGADIDALVQVMGVVPNEDSTRIVHGVNVRMLPLAGRFESAKLGRQSIRMRAPIWDFKGARKAQMAEYARLLGC